MNIISGEEMNAIEKMDSKQNLQDLVQDATLKRLDDRKTKYNELKKKVEDAAKKVAAQLLSDIDNLAKNEKFVEDYVKKAESGLFSSPTKEVAEPAMQGEATKIKAKFDQAEPADTADMSKFKKFTTVTSGNGVKAEKENLETRYITMLQALCVHCSKF